MNEIPRLGLYDPDCGATEAPLLFSRPLVLSETGPSRDAHRLLTSFFSLDFDRRHLALISRHSGEMPVSSIGQVPLHEDLTC